MQNGLTDMPTQPLFTTGVGVRPALLYGHRLTRVLLLREWTFSAMQQASLLLLIAYMAVLIILGGVFVLYRRKNATVAAPAEAAAAPQQPAAAERRPRGLDRMRRGQQQQALAQEDEDVAGNNAVFVLSSPFVLSSHTRQLQTQMRCLKVVG